MKWKKWLVLLLFGSGLFGLLFMDPIAKSIYRFWVSERYYKEIFFNMNLYNHIISYLGAISFSLLLGSGVIGLYFIFTDRKKTKGKPE